ncbi:hypothetical protein CMI37_34650 [Candidatus Pacearchaeota archaeon]|nr:hypothetical protein [Candidatus Pacearchaeota archaeon]|tara:strand:+ start:2260 stop:2871 length:612 start_codon:yes stop_codon:yes gene_type:complete
MKIYYGKGSCTIEGAEVVGIQLKTKGQFKITKTCGDNAILMAKNNKILISLMGEGGLNNLFDYIGELKILSAKVVNKNLESSLATIVRLQDYSELINSKSEDMTTKSEDLNAGYVYKNRVQRTTVDVTTIDNLQTKGELYTADGNLYTGLYHIMLDGAKAMTGAEHSKASEDLYIKKDDKTVKTGITKSPRTMTTKTSSRGGY